MSDLQRLEQRLADLLGLRPRRGAERSLGRAVRTVERELGVSLGEVVARLDRDPDLVGRLAGAITVEETFFLRHPLHFERLVEHVRPRLGTGRRVSVWSAGCSSGEEPYSMAIAIHRGLGAAQLERVEICGTDIDGSAIEKARRAEYGAWSFRGVEPSLHDRYFETLDERTRRVRPELRAAVVFEHRSLLDALAERAAASVDAIFFRNVAIYLTDEARLQIYTGFRRVLRQGGLLVLGPSDPHPPRELFPAEASSEPTRLPSYRPASPSSEPVPETLSSSCGPSAFSSRTAATVQARLPGGPIRMRTPGSRRPAQDRSHGGHGGGLSAALARAWELAHRGRAEEALETVESALAQASSQPALLGLRGFLRLAQSETERGVEDLRAALFLDPTDHWLRFHYAVGLHALHRHRASKAQLTDLLRATEGSPDEELLADGETTLGSLRRAAGELRSRLP